MKKKTLTETYNFLLERFGQLDYNNEDTKLQKFLNGDLWQLYLRGSEFTIPAAYLQQFLKRDNVFALRLCPVDKGQPNRLKNKEGVCWPEPDYEEFVLEIYKRKYFPSDAAAKSILFHEFNHFLNLYIRENKALENPKTYKNIRAHFFDKDIQKIRDYIKENKLDIDIDYLDYEVFHDDVNTLALREHCCPSEFQSYLQTDFQHYKDMFTQRYKARMWPLKISFRDWEENYKTLTPDFTPNFVTMENPLIVITTEKQSFDKTKNVNNFKNTILFKILYISLYMRIYESTEKKLGFPELFSERIYKALGNSLLNLFRFINGEYNIKGETNEEFISDLYVMVYKNLFELIAKYKRKLASAIYNFELDFTTQNKGNK